MKIAKNLGDFEYGIENINTVRDYKQFLIRKGDKLEGLNREPIGRRHEEWVVISWHGLDEGLDTNGKWRLVIGGNTKWRKTNGMTNSYLVIGKLIQSEQLEELNSDG